MLNIIVIEDISCVQWNMIDLSSSDVGKEIFSRVAQPRVKISPFPRHEMRDLSYFTGHMKYSIYYILCWQFSSQVYTWHTSNNTNIGSKFSLPYRYGDSRLCHSKKYIKHSLQVITPQSQFYDKIAIFSYSKQCLSIHKTPFLIFSCAAFWFHDKHRDRLGN